MFSFFSLLTIYNWIYRYDTQIRPPPPCVSNYHQNTTTRTDTGKRTGTMKWDRDTRTGRRMGRSRDMDKSIRALGLETRQTRLGMFFFFICLNFYTNYCFYTTSTATTTTVATTTTRRGSRCVSRVPGFLFSPPPPLRVNDMTATTEDRVTRGSRRASSLR